MYRTSIEAIHCDKKKLSRAGQLHNPTINIKKCRSDHGCPSVDYNTNSCSFVRVNALGGDPPAVMT